MTRRKVWLYRFFNELIEKFENIESGSGEKLKKFMKKAAIKYKIGMTDLVYKPSHSLFEFINLQVLKGLFHLNILLILDLMLESILKILG